MKKIITLIFIAVILVNFAWYVIAIFGSFAYNKFSFFIEFPTLFKSDNTISICHIRDNSLCSGFFCDQEIELSCPKTYIPSDTINGFIKTRKITNNEYSKYRKEKYFYFDDTVYYYNKHFLGL